MNKTEETRYFYPSADGRATSLRKLYRKTEAYKAALNAKVSDNAVIMIFTKDGGYFGTYPGDEIKRKDFPKLQDCAAIMISAVHSIIVWTEDFNKFCIFVGYNSEGFVNDTRIVFDGKPPRDGGEEILFEDLLPEAHNVPSSV